MGATIGGRRNRHRLSDFFVGRVSEGGSTPARLHTLPCGRYNCVTVWNVAPLEEQEDVMAKGQMRSTKEAKKPKSDKNKKAKHQPFGGKMPASVAAKGGKK
jgi:hypothetical protein